MRTLLTVVGAALAITLLLATGNSNPAQAQGLSTYSVVQVGHSHHRHYRHYGSTNWYRGHRYGYRYGYGYGGVRLNFNLGSLYHGYRGYVPYRTYYRVNPYCIGPSYYGYPGGVYFHSGVAPLGQAYRSELAYGPQAVKEFMGVDRNFALGPLAASEPKLVLGAPIAGNQVAGNIGPKVRETNWEAHRRAMTFMDRGDEAFAQTNYAAALADYQKAIDNAPDMPEGHLRKALGLIASGRYALALQSLDRAIVVDPKIATEFRFELGDMYAGNEAAKTQHLEKLAEAALAAPADGELLVLLGAMLHYDRKVLRAEKFFQRAVELGGAGATVAKAFEPPKNGAI